MSTRKDIRDAIIARIKTLDLDGFPCVDVWKGEDRSFNENVQFPAVFVAYVSTDFGENASINGTNYEKDLNYAVFVTTKDSLENSQDGDDQAMAILEQLEAGLPGKIVNNTRRLDIAGTEQRIETVMGRYLFGQTYRVQTVRGG